MTTSVATTKKVTTASWKWKIESEVVLLPWWRPAARGAAGRRRQRLRGNGGGERWRWSEEGSLACFCRTGKSARWWETWDVYYNYTDHITLTFGKLNWAGNILTMLFSRSFQCGIRHSTLQNVKERRIPNWPKYEKNVSGSFLILIIPAASSAPL